MSNPYKIYASTQYVDDQITERLSNHSQPASTIGSGVFAGAVMAHSEAQVPNEALLRNSKLVAEETTPTNNGEICWLYE